MSYFFATLQLRNSPVDSAGELFKPWKNSASPQICNAKNFWFWVSFLFVARCIFVLSRRSQMHTESDKSQATKVLDLYICTCQLVKADFLWVGMSKKWRCYVTVYGKKAFLSKKSDTSRSYRVHMCYVTV